MFIRQLRNKHQLNHLNNKIESILLGFIFVIALIFKTYDSLASPPAISVIAKIDNHIITNIDLLERYQLVLKISKIKISSPQERQIVLNQILQKMIDEELQLKEASSLKITADQDQINSSISEIAKNWHQNPQQLNSFFSKNSLSYDSFLKQLQSQILWSEIIKKEVAPKVKISQSEIDELLELRKIKSDISKFFISEIFIPSNYSNQNTKFDSKELALTISNQLKNGKNFNNFVKQFSRSATAEFGGEIGWIGSGDVDKRIYQEVSQTKVGEVTNPVLMEDGYYLFKVSDKKTFSTLTERDLEQVRNVIFNKKLQLLAREYLMNLHKNSYIEINQEALSHL